MNTQEQVIELANRAGVMPCYIGDSTAIERFATLVRNALLEEFEQSTPPDKTPFDTCPTCEALARAVMCDNVGKA